MVCFSFCDGDGISEIGVDDSDTEMVASGREEVVSLTTETESDPEYIIEENLSQPDSYDHDLIPSDSAKICSLVTKDPAWYKHHGLIGNVGALKHCQNQSKVQEFTPPLLALTFPNPEDIEEDEFAAARLKFGF